MQTLAAFSIWAAPPAAGECSGVPVASAAPPKCSQPPSPSPGQWERSPSQGRLKSHLNNRPAGSLPALKPQPAVGLGVTLEEKSAPQDQFSEISGLCSLEKDLSKNKTTIFQHDLSYWIILTALDSFSPSALLRPY